MCLFTEGGKVCVDFRGPVGKVKLLLSTGGCIVPIEGTRFEHCVPPLLFSNGPACFAFASEI